MTESIHALATWRGGFGGSGEISAPGLSTTVSLPKNLGGAGVGTNPEELLAAAAASCFLATFGIILAKSKIAYEAMTATAALEMSATLPPRVTRLVFTARILSSHDAATLKALALEAKAKCVIGRALDPELTRELDLEVIGGDGRHRPKHDVEVRL